ncbi:MAG: flagellar export protein FliJ [Candidatus Eisenbacteria sp.]|nr:flagellar export protein FliJ [Candidatus Eisenbacteria bacterium]
MESKKCVEDLKKQDLANAQRVLDREKSVFLHLRSKGEDCRQEMLRRPPGPLDVIRESIHRARFARLMTDVDRQDQTVKHSSRRVCHEREDLVQCSKERRILENLKEKGLIGYMREWTRREQKETDEVGRDVFLRRANRAAK